MNEIVLASNKAQESGYRVRFSLWYDRHHDYVECVAEFTKRGDKKPAWFVAKRLLDPALAVDGTNELIRETMAQFIHDVVDAA